MPTRKKLRLTLAIAGLAWLVIIVRWRSAPSAMSFDDAYYYFTIGRNWAHGYVSTFGIVDRTNGYHPLWQLICIVPYLLGLDGTAAVRTLLVVQLGLWLVGWRLILDQVASAVDGWKSLAERPGARRTCDAVVVVVTLALVGNPFLFKMVVNGLESGLVFPVGAALLTWSLRFRGRFVSRSTRTQRLVTGGLLALAFLSRTDAIMLMGVIGVWCLFDGGTRGAPVAISTRVGRTTEILAIPAVVVAIYLGLNQVIFDTPMQISGTIKRLPLTPTRAIVAMVWAAVGIAIILGARKPISTRSKAPRTRRFFAATGWYVAFCVGLVGYYSTLQSVPYLWYFAPLALYGMWIILLFTSDLVEGSMAETGVRAALPALVVTLPFVAIAIWSIPGFISPGNRALMVHDAAAGQWIDSHLPPSAVVASWDAGVIGYYSNRPMVNLDGVVNSVAWYDALKTGRTAEFLSQRKVQWAANHGGDVDGRDPGIDLLLRQFFGDAAGTITVVHRSSFAYSGTLDGSRTDTSTKRMGTYVYRIEP